jgi:hypothetical protein
VTVIVQHIAFEAAPWRTREEFIEPFTAPNIQPANDAAATVKNHGSL